MLSARSLQGEVAWMSARDQVSATWGNRPAQQQLTHKQIKQSSPGLTHLSASHVGGGDHPVPTQCYAPRREKDKAGAGSVMAASCGSPKRLTPVDNQPVESNTPGCKTLISQTCLNLSCCTCCCGTFRQQRRLSVLSLSGHLTLKVSHSTTLILHSVHIHKSKPYVYTALTVYTFVVEKVNLKAVINPTN